MKQTLADLIIAGEAFKAGVNRGYNRAWEGLKQSENEINEYLGLEPEGTANAYTKERDLVNTEFNQGALQQYSPIASAAGQVVGQAAPYTVLPGGTLAKAIAGGGAQGFLDYVPEGGSRAKNAAIGAGVGGVTHAALQGVTKGINALTGKARNPEEAALIELANQHGVHLNYQDINNGRIAEVFGDIADRAPITAKLGRRSQMQQAEKAANRVTQTAYDELIDTPYNGIPQLKEVAAGDSIRAKSAQNALRNLEKAGEDWNDIIKASGNTKLVRAKIIADRQYDKVAELADKYGSIDKTGIINSIDSAIAKSANSIVPDKGLISLLREIKNNVVSKDLNFSAARAARGDIGQEISSYYKGKDALVGESGARALEDIKQSIDKELNRFANSHDTNLKKDWHRADQFYKSNVAPYKDRALAGALKSESNADEIYSKFITLGRDEAGKGGDRAQKFFNALDDKGKSAVRYGMVKNAYEAALDSHKSTFDPAKFSSELDRIASSKQVFFKGKAKEEIDGFKKLMRYAEKSKSTLDNINSNEVTALVKGLTATGSGHAISMLFNTKAGRDLLMASAKLDPASEGFKKLLQRSAVKEALKTSNAAIERSAGDVDKESMINYDAMSLDELQGLLDQEYNDMSLEELDALLAEEPKQGAVQEYLVERNARP